MSFFAKILALAAALCIASSAFAQSPLKCTRRTFTQAQCEAKNTNAACLSDLDPELRKNAVKNAVYGQLYPVCDDEDLTGWCPCNHPSSDGLERTWISTHDLGTAGFTIKVYPSLLMRRSVASTFFATCGMAAGSYRVTWDFGDGTRATGGLVDHQYSNTGNFTVSSLCTRISDGHTMEAAMTVAVIR